MPTYSVYALIGTKRPVYIGMTTNIQERLHRHRANGKVFGSHYIIETFRDKSQALAAERVLIKFLSLFGNEIYNTQAFFHLIYKETNLR
jgi:predicted GIY-YIG superfamily endonuclease